MWQALRSATWRVSRKSPWRSINATNTGVLIARNGTLPLFLKEVAASSYDPKISAFITELCGIRGVNRRDVESVVESVLNIPISQGGIQKVLDRSKALEPVYEDIAQRICA